MQIPKPGALRDHIGRIMKEVRGYRWNEERRRRSIRNGLENKEQVQRRGVGDDVVG